MVMRRAISTTFAAAFVLTPTAALAHAGHGDASGPMNGCSHPITGIDHSWQWLTLACLLPNSVGGLCRWLEVVELSRSCRATLHQSLSRSTVPARYDLSDTGLRLLPSALCDVNNLPTAKAQRQSGGIASITK
jgi:hypothetical protein